MKILKPVSTFCLITTLAAAYSFAGCNGEPNAKKESGSQPAGVVGGNAAKMLSGVTHFKDDDVRFRTFGGINIFVDPTSGPTDNLVVKSGMLKPDLILITHSHGDHFQPAILQEYLKLNPKAILAGPPGVVKSARKKEIKMNEVKPGQDYTMAGISFHTMPAYFTEGESHPKHKQWVGYVLKLNGTRYYVTGDTQPLPEMEEQKVDVLFPLLLGCGGNIEQAVKMAKLCKARVVVPVHHGGNEEIIKKYLTQLPQGVQGAYFMDARLIISP